MLTTLALLLLLLLGLLAIPLSLTFRLRWPQPAQREVLLEWAFGLLRVHLPSLPAAPALTHDTPPPPMPARRKRPARRPAPGVSLSSLLRQPPFRRRLFKYLRDCWSAVHKEEVQLRLRIGLDDPADTGRLWALMGPLAALLANSKGATFALEPEFDEQTFELESSGRIELVPLELLTLTLTLLFSPSVWQGLYRLRKAA